MEVTPMNEQADNEELLERVYGRTREDPCIHGHFDCAEYERGPCANEEYARLVADPPADRRKVVDEAVFERNRRNTPCG
jgi:hypothetical protein